MLNYKKPAFWIASIAVAAAVVAAVCLLTNPADRLELPGTVSVLSIEMEQINEGESIASVTLTDSGDIEAVLSALSSAKKTLSESVNDSPIQNNYLIVRLTLAKEQRTLFFYSDGGSCYIEEPYVGIYKSNRGSGLILHKVYTDGMQRANFDGGTIDISFDASDDIPQVVREYATDFVRNEIAYYNGLDYHITNARITSLTKMNTGTASLTKDIQMWLLEYRLLPENTDKVILAGGMKMEDGWLTEQGSTGQPLLVLVRDFESETWQRIGITNTLTVVEEYQGDYTAATMAMYHSFLASKDASITWEYMPARSSVFPALPLRFDIPFEKVHATVDSGTLYLNDNTKVPNYVDCGREMDYSKGEYILWSPHEGTIFDSSKVSVGCVLHFKIYADDGTIYSGTISIKQTKLNDNGKKGIWVYKVTLTETDTGLVLGRSEEYGGGAVLTLANHNTNN